MAIIDKIIPMGTRAFVTYIGGGVVVIALISLIWLVLLIPVSLLNMSPAISIPYPDLPGLITAGVSAIGKLALPYTTILFAEAAVALTNLIILGFFLVIIVGSFIQFVGGAAQNNFLISAGTQTVQLGSLGVTQGSQLTREILTTMQTLSERLP